MLGTVATILDDAPPHPSVSIELRSFGGQARALMTVCEGNSYLCASVELGGDDLLRLWLALPPTFQLRSRDARDIRLKLAGGALLEVAAIGGGVRLRLRRKGESSVTALLTRRCAEQLWDALQEAERRLTTWQGEQPAGTS